jgi:hypothetical protein
MADIHGSVGRDKDDVHTVLYLSLSATIVFHSDCYTGGTYTSLNIPTPCLRFWPGKEVVPLFYTLASIIF